MITSTNHNEIILFADDTNIFVKAKSLKLAYQASNELLRQINDYMVCNKLHINLEKSCYMHFKKYIPISSRVDSLSNDMTYNIHINNSELKKVTHTKFLGVIIDENLTWEQHIKALSKKLASCTGSLNRIIQFLPKNMYKELYYTLFQSYLAYGVTVWGKASKSKLRLLFKAQKKAIWVVFGNKEQFLDKFRTCAKARPYPDQKLGHEFFNKEHTKPLFIANHILTLQNDMTYNIHINNNELKKVTHTKFLGVIIDENLTWEQHIKALSKKLASCTGSLNRIIQFLPKNMHKELYYTLFQSYLAYGVTVWGKA